MSNASQKAATLTKASGHVYAERQGTRLTLAEGDSILSTDTVITDSTATAEVRFNDGATASLSPGTFLEVKSFAFGEGIESSFILNLAQGTLRSVSGEVVKQNPDAFKILTPQATVGIRGTELFTAVQADGQEVHAVLHIGKDHIVVITSSDGRSVVMDQALQAVTMTGGEAGGMVKQTFKLTELQDVIKAIAPTQMEKPVNLQGTEAVPGQQGTEAVPGQQGPEAVPGQQGAEAPPDTQPVQPSSSSSVVIILYEGETAATVAQAQSGTATGTLISVVDHLQGTLADAGFSVEIAGETGLAGGDTLDTQPIITPPKLPPPPEQEAPAEPTGPQVHVIDGDYAGNWHNDFGALIDAGRAQHITINGNVTGHVEANVIPPDTSMTTTGDTISVNGNVLDGGRVLGDANFVAVSGTTVVLGNDSMTFGHLASSVTGTPSAVLGDSERFQADNGATVIFGNDTIVGNSMGQGGLIYGDSSSGKGGLQGGTVVLGNDTITIHGAMSGDAAIYGDILTNYAGAHNFSGGDDTVRVGSMTDNSTVFGGLGNDSITVTGNMSGDVLVSNGSGGTTPRGAGVSGGMGNDSITVGSMSGRAVAQGDEGNDTITVIGGMSDFAQANGGDGNDTITVSGGVSDSVKIIGGDGNDTITVNGGVGDSAQIFGGDGNDVITVNGMDGGTIRVGAGTDTLTLNNMSGGVVDMSNGTGARVFDSANSSFDCDTLTLVAKFTDGSSMTLSGDIINDLADNLGSIGTASLVMNLLLSQQADSFLGINNTP